MTRSSLALLRGLSASAVLVALPHAGAAATAAQREQMRPSTVRAVIQTRAAAGRRIYAAVQPLEEVAIYDPVTGSQIGTITTAIANPFGVFLDHKRLYVANAGQGSVPSSVTVYASGQSNPVQTYAVPTAESARGVVVRGSLVYVLAQDRSGSVCHLALQVYKIAETNPAREVALPESAGCFTPSIALSSNGSVYVAYIQGTTGSGSASGYSIIAPKTHKAVNVILPNFRYGNSGLAADAAGNVLLDGCVVASSGVCTGDQGTDVWYFPAGQTSPALDFTPGYGTTSGLTFGPKETSFYVADIYGAALYQYAYPSGQYLGAIPGPNYEFRGITEGNGP